MDKEVSMSKKHAILMVVCCLVGIGAAAAVFLFKVPTNNVLVFGMLLMCPLSHFLMMGMMGRHSHGEGESQETHSHHPPTLPAPKELGKG